jgi:hypothetical protein
VSRPKPKEVLFNPKSAKFKELVHWYKHYPRGEPKL